MLKLEHVCKVFDAGTANKRTALDDISLEVKKGEFMTLIGANGAGKSTLFNAVCGSFMTDSGRILLGGEDITLQPEYKRAFHIGRLFQDPLRGTAPNMTIEENLALAAGHGTWLSRIGRAERKRFRERLAELDMGLEDRLDEPVGLLSGGQRQALTLLMATIDPPKLLLLDEHTAALDPAAAEKILSMTKKVVSENALTCLMITHDMQSALDLGSRTLMLDRGRIIYDVSGEERKHLTVPDLLEKFKAASGRAMNNDRMLLV